MGSNVFIKTLDSIDSTNRYVRDEAASLWNEAGAAKVVALSALSQTSGRGQRGNVWLSEGGKNLLLSILVRPCWLGVKEQFLLSQAISLALLRAMEHYGLHAEIKWPNDIYVGNRKLAGVLVELDCMSGTVEKAVIGVGLNVNQSSFPAMDRIPVSMAMIGGGGYSVDDVRDKLLESFLYYYEILERGEKTSIENEYKKHLKGYMLPMSYNDGKSVFEAAVVDVEPCGRLCLRDAAGTLRCYGFKEVELLL